MNLMFITFLLFKSGHSPEFMDTYPPTVDGDDSIFAHLFDLDTSILVRLGANAKFQQHANLNEASFCKMVFNTTSIDIVTNPIDAMLNFGYTDLYYINASDKTFKTLIRAKSMSMLYTYPACPILKQLALYGLRVTQDVLDRDVLKLTKTMDTYKKDIFLEVFSNRHSLVLNKPVHIESRLMVEYSFGIIVQVQFLIEHYLESLVKIQPLIIPCLQDLVGYQRQNCYYDYSRFQSFSCF